MARKAFRVYPITPIHVGTGEALAAEEYFLRESERKLVRYLPAKTIAKLTGPERAGFLQALDGNNMEKPIEVLRKAAARDPETWLYEVTIGTESIAALKGAINTGTFRSGEVRPMPWNLSKGRVVVAGSAIKGAIRTAVLGLRVAQRWHQDDPWAQAWLKRIRGTTDRRQLGQMGNDLEREVLRFSGDHIERDPFRLVRVSDGEVEANGVRVDRAALERQDGEDVQAQGIQMHLERLYGMSDGKLPDGFRIEIEVEEGERDWKPERKRCVDQPCRFDEIATACNWHYGQRFEAEAHRFPRLYPENRLKHLRSALDRPGGWLMRIGRHSHFESLSVEGLRWGERRTASRRSYEERGWERERPTGLEQGSSRTVCRSDGGAGVPFGWAAFLPEGS